MNFDKGYISPYMITNTESLKAELQDPYIIITDKKVSTIAEILPTLEKIATSGKKDIVIIADDVDGEALTTLVVNKLRGTLNVLAVKAPEFGENKKEVLEDIAVLTGGKVISEDKGMKFDSVELTVLGRAGKVISTKDNTTIVSGKGKKKDIEARVSTVKNQIEKAESKYEKEKLQKRLAKLSGGVAVIKVGAATETELTYIKHKMEDALAATRAAYEEGVVAGGGTALFKAARNVKYESRKNTTGSNLDEFRAGYSILVKALEEPLRQIVANGGQKDPGVVINGVGENNSANFGFDARRGEFVENMVKAGIIDPLKVTRTALENAVSVSAILLTTEVVITDKPKDESCNCSGQMPGMGGMM
jgi:chaperonin GroEL